MSDRYRDFTELRRSEGSGEFRIRLRKGRSSTALMAPHGGCIEPGTTEIAEAVAGREHSFYTFSGRKREKNWHLHITSTRFDEPGAMAMAAHCRRVVTVHGAGSRESLVEVGGLDGEAIDRVVEHLSRAGFHVERARGERTGRSPENLCNRGTNGRGVQLEISRGLRMEMFENLKRAGRATRTKVFDRFVDALRAALSEEMVDATRNPEDGETAMGDR